MQVLVASIVHFQRDVCIFESLLFFVVCFVGVRGDQIGIGAVKRLSVLI